MYHPSRGGVRGGRDQFKWDDVKVDKHRENYLGHSIKAPVGRWQKGKDLFWYNRDKKSEKAESEAIKEEIKRIKEDEEQAMREALGLAPKRANRLQGNRLDKHEYAELVKRGTTAEDMGAGHAEAAQVQGLGLYKLPRNQSESSTQPHSLKEIGLGKNYVDASAAARDDESPDDQARKKRRHEERGDEVRTREEKKDDKRRGEKRRDKREEKRSYDTGEKLNYRHRDKGKRRHDSD